MRRGLLALLLLLLVLPLGADTLDEVGVRGVLRWAGDASGGGPYIFDGPDGALTGFEVELARELAGRLGVKDAFVQGQWDKLPQLMDRGGADIVLNGYEWSAEREASWPSSVPYYVYTLQLMARKSDGLSSWEDLRRPREGRRQRVGVLSGSAAERCVRERLGESVEILGYDGVTNVLRLVEQGQLDATVQDLPIAVHYGPQFPALVRVGDPVAPGWYVIFTRKGDERLKARINEALRGMFLDGTLRRIYAKYGIWSPEQESLVAIGAHWPPAAASAPRAPTEPLRWFALLAKAAWTTLELAVLSMPLAMLVGLLVALGRLYGPRWLGIPLEVYVEFLRGTPLLLQLFVIYYLLPGIGIRIPAFWAGVLGLAINYSAYEAENYRAGLLAVPKGQWEAALSLGMAPRVALWRVVVPQALRIVIPPVTNDFIALFKDTSVCSVIAVVDLTGAYNRLYNDHPREVLQLGLMAAFLYLAMSYPMSLLARRLERRLGHGRIA